jgi:hypothetical protein
MSSDRMEAITNSAEALGEGFGPDESQGRTLMKKPYHNFESLTQSCSRLHNSVFGHMKTRIMGHSVQ